jgi:hypothetical protein
MYQLRLDTYLSEPSSARNPLRFDTCGRLPMRLPSQRLARLDSTLLHNLSLLIFTFA